MSLSSKNIAYKDYVEQAKAAFNAGDIKRARMLFLKAADITNQITLESTNVDIKNEYYQVTQTILEFVKKKCSNETKCVKQESENKNDSKEANVISVDVQSNEKISLDEALDRLNSLIGLEQVKKVINDMVKQIRVFRMRKSNNLVIPDMSYHMVFTGNPGTGKTTVARIVGQIYHALGILSKGQLVEVDRSKLVVGYVGQTGPQTNKIIEQAMGGVLFIDEAYSLAQGGESDFGSEAIATLLKAMEDKRDDFAVIVAGYERLMGNFIDSNPGLSSRFKTYINFADYTPIELYNIFVKQCKSNDYKLSDDLSEYLYGYFENIYTNRNHNFGNGRDVRNLFEHVVTNQSRRLIDMHNPTKEDMMLLTCKDLDVFN